MQRTPFINGKIDFESLRVNGWCKADVSDLMTSTLLGSLNEEEYVADYESRTGDGFEQSSVKYASLYVAKNRMTERPGGFYEVWLSHLMSWASPYIGMYMNQPTAEDATLAIMQCRKGYFMDWHHDAGERAVAIGLLYINDGNVEDEHGGVLKVSKVKRNDQGEVESRVETGAFKPTNGTLVLLDGASIEFEHMVTPYVLEGGLRYCLSASLGMPREWK